MPLGTQKRLAWGARCHVREDQLPCPQSPRAAYLRTPAQVRLCVPTPRYSFPQAQFALPPKNRRSTPKISGLIARPLSSRVNAIALTEPEEARASPQATRQDKKRIKELERELLRKDRVLAETAALLVLSKKVAAIFNKGEAA